MTSQDRINESPSQLVPAAPPAAVPEESTGRLEAFSDGVFAIAITLLILNIQVPDFKQIKPGTLLNELGDKWPIYIAYVTSFLTIGIIWINHHITFRYIKRANRILLSLNLLLLLPVSFIPFPTALLGEAIGANIDTDTHTAAVVYSGTLLAMGIMFALLWRYAIQGHRLVDKRVPEQELRAIERQGLLGVSFFLTAFILAFFSVEISVGITLLVSLSFFLPRPTDRF